MLRADFSLQNIEHALGAIVLYNFWPQNLRELLRECCNDVFSTVSRVLVFVGVLDNCFVLCVVIFNENSR